MTGKYDTIVIGNDLSSLVAAELSSHSGLKTLLLNEGDIPEVYSESGFAFNIDPFPLTGVGPGESCLHPYLEEDFFQLNRASLRRLNPGLQVISPGHRVDFFNEKERLIRDLDREFPGSAECLHEFYESAGRASRSFSRLTLENPSLRLTGLNLRKSSRFLRLLMSLRKEYNRFSNKMDAIQSDAIFHILEAQAALLSGCAHQWGSGRPLLAAPYFLAVPLQGMFYPFGGKHQIRNNIKERFLSQAGACIGGCEIVKIDIDGKNCGIEWTEEGVTKRSAGKNLIVSAKWKGLDGNLLGDRRFRKIAERLRRRCEKALYPFTVHVGVLNKGIPEKMSEYAILVQDETGDFNTQDILFMELSSRGDTVRAPEGKRALSATRFIERPPSSRTDEDLRKIASGILERLDGLLPFLAENVAFMDIERCISLYKETGEAVGRKLRLRRRPITGLYSMSNRTPLKNVFLTGDELLGMGFAGEVLSGVNAANLAAGG